MIINLHSAVGNVPSNFLKSVCTQNFLCATFYRHLSIFRMTCIKYVQNHFLKENLCALKIFLCALISRHVCTCAQLRAGMCNLSLVPPLERHVCQVSTQIWIRLLATYSPC